MEQKGEDKNGNQNYSLQWQVQKISSLYLESQLQEHLQAWHCWG